MPDPYRETTEGEPEAVKELKETPPATAGGVEKEQPAVPEKPPVVPAQEQMPPPPVGGPGPVSGPSATNTTPQAEPALSADLENDRQLKILVDLAFEQGIDKAVEAARASENPYLIDKFHDTLVDELRQKLVEGGKLKEV